jgi:hypothetical protein
LAGSTGLHSKLADGRKYFILSIPPILLSGLIPNAVLVVTLWFNELPVAFPVRLRNDKSLPGGCRDFLARRAFFEKAPELVAGFG